MHHGYWRWISEGYSIPCTNTAQIYICRLHFHARFAHKYARIMCRCGTPTIRIRYYCMRLQHKLLVLHIVRSLHPRYLQTEYAPGEGEGGGDGIHIPVSVHVAELALMHTLHKYMHTNPKVCVCGLCWEAEGYYLRRCRCRMGNNNCSICIVNFENILYDGIDR